MSTTETELKLRVRKEDLAPLRRCGLLGAAGRAHLLETTYFDTADGELQRRGVVLRIRKERRRLTQTLKSGGAPGTGFATRLEVASAVPSPRPQLSSLPGEAARHLGKLAEEDLVPVFSTRVRRRVASVARRTDGEAPSTIEVAIDDGTILTASGAEAPIEEIELELKSGEPAALFELAEALVAVAPLRLDTRSKSARGYRLAAGDSGKAVHAAPIALTRGMTVEAAISAILNHCLAHLVANDDLVVEQRSPEALHQMRVALRRLRSALGLFRPLVPPEQHARLTAEIRWLTEVLAPARDADVFLADLLAPVSEAFGNDGEMRALEGVARERRDAAHAEAVMALRSPRYAALLLLLGAALEGRSWRAQPVSEISAKLLTPIGDLADELLATRHRKARKAGRRFARLSEEERHRLRIALKKLRYAADFFRSLYAEKEVKRYVKRLARLQSALGHNNDVMMATHFLESLTARRGSGRIARLGSAPGKLVGWYARGVHEREAELVTEWHRFRKTKPFWRKRQEQPALEEPGALRTVDN